MTETPLDVASLHVVRDGQLDYRGGDRLRRVGVFEGKGRDPRDGPRSFSRTTAFLVELARDEATALAGGDDAEDARWFPLDALPTRLAFNHAEIIRAALALGPR